MISTTDWWVLILAMASVLLYGFWKNRNGSENSQSFLAGRKELRWWTIGLSIMATQASAVTFLSTPGQGYSDGLRFVQFYFGMPIAMFILAIFILPIYYRLNITTAYEYLEQRFDLRIRSLTAVLFLIQRSIAAAITLNAPSIVLSVMLGWDLFWTNAVTAVLVVAYTTFGGHKAISRSQELQMTIMLGGLVFAFLFILHNLPENIGFAKAWEIAAAHGKTNAVNWDFSLTDRYTFWSGVLGATFLFLSYFGTDQSQVGRYLSGRSLSESRFGLLFNGLIKVPMQFLVLCTGVMVFVFYQFNQPPLLFNPQERQSIEAVGLQEELKAVEMQADLVFSEKKALLEGFSKGKTEDLLALNQLQDSLQLQSLQLLRTAWGDPNAQSKGRDYVFLTFILNQLPKGLIGLMLAMIFCAAWSTTASELNALTTASMVDIYKRSLVQGKSEGHYLLASRLMTVAWGAFILWFATQVSFFENLIQAVNMVGSVFYGTLLGIFFTGFFLKNVGAKSVFWAAVLAQSIVCLLYFGWSKDPYLWYNPLGCFLVMGFSLLLSKTVFAEEKAE